MTTTPKTPEQIAAQAITEYWEDENRSGPNRGPEAHDAMCGEAAVSALRAAGLLGGEPTEEQIEAALSASTSANPADEHHDAEERQADGEDHAATVTGDFGGAATVSGTSKNDEGQWEEVSDDE